MNSQQLIKKLGYSDSPAFLQGERLKEHHGYSFFFAQAEREEHCNLKGVYTLLCSPDRLSSSSLTPVVYVCEADNEAKAEEIHKRVWNQNIVPFLIVVTPKNKKIRLYSGFEYHSKQSDEDRVLEVANNANEVLSKLSALKSESIDSGDIWKQRPISVEGRVDRHLLADLKKLSEVLTGREYKLPVEHAHTLIGKYIYLKYLRDRDILSDDRFKKAEIKADDIFGRGANRNKLYQLETYLDSFLNGSVFPLPGGNEIQTKYVQKVADVFKGDDPKSGQQVLFDIYDFSYVPIETLSVVYQQFLHAKGQGRGKGAYYTPVHLVNFILDELDTKKPLRKGMKILDPSCGSGAFLVQCYRRLVESIVRVEGKLKPTELRKLLTDHIFGLDADEEACRVAELSLSLTLLDYIEPHDLRTYPTFKLPELHNKNIFHCKGGFFDEGSSWAKSIPKKGYDWIVGNPPWKNKEKYEDAKLYDQKALHWINTNRKIYPVDNYQAAEAFAWKTTELLVEDGQCGLLMPALTLFKKQGHKFRAKFFSEIETWCIVNFANIRRYLFEKAINPAAAFFYSGKKDWDKSEHYITTYAPFAVEQDSQLNQKGRSKKIWSVFVNYTTIKEIPLRDVKKGSSIPWKIAMWGTHRDKLFVDYFLHHSSNLKKLKKKYNLEIQQGPALRLKSSEEDVEFISELEGKEFFDAKKVQGEKCLFSIPEYALAKLPKKRCYLRKKTGKKSLLGCRPPHIIVDASMRFAVYSDKYTVFTAKPFGISGSDEKLLKAIALFLNSEFVKYMDISLSASLGIERNRSGEKYVLESFPIPVEALLADSNRISQWAELHDEIVAADKRERDSQQDRNAPVFNSRQRISLPSLDTLLEQMNNKVYKCVGISNKQQWLIEDMLGVRMKLNDGNFTPEKAIKSATEEEIYKFVCIFQEELDLFLDHSDKKKVHRVKVLYTDSTAIMIVDHLVRSMATKPEVVKVQDNQTRRELAKLQGKLTETRSQWMYFTRCLQIHEARRTYIFKPRQRLYWLKSQALAEADDFIAEKLATDK